MRLRFSVRSILILTTLVAAGIVFWPRPYIPGAPDLEGRVTNANGVGLSGVTVRLGGPTNRWVRSQTTTDANGSYFFESVTNNPVVESDSERPAIYVELWFYRPGYSAIDNDTWLNINIASVKDKVHRRDITMTRN